MSFLSILLFTSAFYFAYGRPDATALDQSSVSDGGYPTITPDGASSDANAEQFKEQIDSFVKDMGEVLDKYLKPMMTQLPDDKQEDMKSMALNGCYGYINYVILMIKENSNNGTTNGTDTLPQHDDIMIDFESLEPLDETSGFIPAQDNASTVSETKTEISGLKKETEGNANAPGSMVEPAATQV